VGREARCTATWGAHSGDVTIHLDAVELSARGAFRASAPLASLRDVRVAGDTLHCRAGEHAIALVLGRAAPRWAAALQKPPPTLAAKLGIAAGTRVRVVGTVDDDALAAALTAGTPAGEDRIDVIVARVDDADALARAAHDHRAALERGVPIWIVYTKGPRAPLGETAVRAMLRERSLIDRKVASVSPALTALQFTKTVRS
jgi:hypothetical protein